jgi:hypothetical protein
MAPAARLRPAIAAHLASGVDMAEAVMGAQEYTWRTLAAGFRPGMGQFIPDRLFWSRDEDEENGCFDMKLAGLCAVTLDDPLLPRLSALVKGGTRWRRALRPVSQQAGVAPAAPRPGGGDVAHLPCGGGEADHQ